MDSITEMISIRANAQHGSNNMNKCNFKLECGQSGFLDDGRYFYIMSIPSIMMCSDGSFKYGDIEVAINNEHHVMRISEFIEHIKSIGNLEIR